jgi:hypothetical protein
MPPTIRTTIIKDVQPGTGRPVKEFLRIAAE